VTPTDSPIVERASINPDGSLAPWQDLASQMTTTRGGVQAAAANGSIYALGGGAAGQRFNSVERAVVNPDGTLGPWQLTAPMTAVRGAHAAVLANGHLYALGGAGQLDGGGQSPRLKSVEYARVNPDGSLDPWQPTTSLTTERQLFAAVATGSFIYALGGEGSVPSPLSSVERAALPAPSGDQTPPTCTAVASPSSIWPPNKKLVNVTVTVTPADSGGSGLATPPFVLISVTSNEAITPSDYPGFVIGTSDVSGQLRADRAGNGTGRIYTLTYRVADNAGNTATCTATVTVPHDQGH
jgi:hypothetical protein